MTYRSPLIAAALLALAASSQAANLVTNGSFEAGGPPVQNNGDAASQQLFGGSTALAGWTVTGNQIAWIGVGNPYGISASTGDDFLDLTGWASTGSGVTQTLATTAGTHYTVQFDLGNSVNYNFGTQDALTVSFGGQSQSVATTQANSPSSWETYSFDFVASGASTALSFTGLTAQFYIGLDNVVVTSASAVPEPGSAALLMIGLLGLAGATARRRA